jgi:hypothetical protein
MWFCDWNIRINLLFRMNNYVFQYIQNLRVYDACNKSQGKEWAHLDKQSIATRY